jgi:hypothetical protein
MRSDWRTPKGIYDALNEEFHFSFDPCPPKPKFNGLMIPWGPSNYVNPPYGPHIRKWLEKALIERNKGKRSVFLLPARTDTKWFHQLVLPYAAEIRFVQGRLKFKGAKWYAPFPSMIVIFESGIYHGRD